MNTLVPLLASYYLMYLSLSYSYWLTLGLAVLTALFTVRLFIIQHDCGHMSFFPSRKWNDSLGYVCSLFTMVPYYYWKRQHAIHHSTNGNLDHRGIGDMDVFTVDEYLKLSKWERLRYRAYRNPIVFLLFGPLVLFFYINRHWTDPVQYSQRDKRNVLITNLTIAASFALVGFGIGWIALLKIVAPVLYIAAGAGIWLFYIQHQFEHTYWKPDQEWNFVRAAMQGSSFYKLPKVLQWFTGNIGFHHIHHLSPGIPNYRLEKIYVENPEFREVYEVTLASAVKTIFLSVWDIQQQRLISFRELRRKYTAQPA
ncbi:MAG: fatty acid desaturase [Calditrichaeota bacterium]|nr:fatty acid desaturase [Calditrichota bacterium]MCB9367357.1 fatty acid desaturase [Calditrichota bacterium]MCB9391323.1 fatty acid desaturase [Calditrichota bacterium]